jgi:hypothetical protein
MATETQIVREAPEIEAYKLGLLQDAKGLADQPVGVPVIDPVTGEPVMEEYTDADGNTQTRQKVQLPPQQIAGFTDLQTDAFTAAGQAGGIGGYQPFLTEAGYSMGDAQQQLRGVYGDASPFIRRAMQTADPYRQASEAALLQSMAGVPGEVGAAQQGIQGALQYGQAATGGALTDMDAASVAARGQAQQGIGSILNAAGLIPGQVQTGQAGMQAAGTGGLQAAGTAGQQAQQAIQSARGITGQAGQQILGAAGAAAPGTQAAILQSQAAGQMGVGAAQQGIAGLTGGAAQFDPSTISQYMSPYEDAAVQQALQDIARQGQIQQQAQAAQAVGAGAFGGSRAGVQAAETARAQLEQQGRTAAQMRAQGYQSAAAQAQQAFEQARSRQLQSAGLTGQLGQAGAGSALQAAQQAGALGQSQAQLGVGAGQAAGQLGLSAEQLAAQTGLQTGQLGLSAQQQAGQFAGQGAQLGLTGAQQQAALAQQAAQLGISTEQLAAQLAQQGGQLGQSQAQLGLSGAQAGGQLGLQGKQAEAGMAGQMGDLGLQYGQFGLQTGQALGQLGLQSGESLGTLGLRQASLGELSQNTGLKDIQTQYELGKQQQGQQQAVLEAKRQSDMAQLYEPYNRLSYLSDIYKGAPSTQQTIATSTTPNVSPAQQFMGLGIAGLSAAAGANKAGLFG